MKKKFFAVATATMLTMSMGITAFADTESGMLAHYKFDDSLKNEVTGEDATQTGQKFAEPAGNKVEYVDGALSIAKGNTDGFNLNVKPTSDSYTISFWTMTNDVNGFAQPIVWYGGKDQTTTQAWVGVWPGLNAVWANGGPQIGSASGAAPDRFDVLPNKSILVEGSEVAYEWTMVTMVVDNAEASLYYDGVDVTKEKSKVASVTADDRSVYIGVNAWDVPYCGLIDELYVYDRALTADDIKELYDATKTVESQDMVGIEKVTYPDVQLSDKDEFLEGGEEEETAEESNNTTIIIVVIVAVVVVAVVAAVVVSSKKKKSGTSDEE